MTYKVVGECNIRISPKAHVQWGENVICANLNLSLGDNAQLIVGDNCRLQGEINIAAGSKLIVGERTLMNDPRAVIRCDERTTIKIGKFCLFANVTIYSTDYHAIYDYDSGKRINYGEDIFIDNYVWLALGVIVLKGSIIPAGCVVGAGSVVSRKFTENSTLICGNPAKIVKRKILWTDKMLDLHPNFKYADKL